MAEADVAFAEFVHARWPSLYRTAYVLCGEHAMAEDLVQSALTKAYTSWSKVCAASSMEAYVCGIMFNEIKRWRRRRSWSAETPAEFLPERPTHPSSDPADDHALMDAILGLPPGQRAIIVLRYYQDMTADSVAEVLGCSVGTVKRQTHDAIKKLRTTSIANS